MIKNTTLQALNDKYIKILIEKTFTNQTEYDVYTGMIQRCLDKYKLHGGGLIIDCGLVLHSKNGYRVSLVDGLENVAIRASIPTSINKNSLFVVKRWIRGFQFIVPASDLFAVKHKKWVEVRGYIEQRSKKLLWRRYLFKNFMIK